MLRLAILSLDRCIRGLDGPNFMVRIPDNPKLTLFLHPALDGLAEGGFLSCQVLRMDVASPILVTDKAVASFRHPVD